MNLTAKLSEEDIEAIANRVVQKLKGNDSEELLDVFAAAKLLNIQCKDNRNISNRMSQLSNPKYTKNPLPVHHQGGNGRTRVYKRKDIEEFMLRGRRG